MQKLADLIVQDLSISVEDNHRISISYYYVSKDRATELNEVVDKIIKVIKETGNYETPKDDYTMKGEEGHIDYSRFVWIKEKEQENV